MLPVNKPYLPEITKYKSYVDRIFESNHLTNRGPLVQELESKLSARFSVKHSICVANGSLALQVVYKAMELTGDIITTPFSFAATSGTIKWEGLNSIFCDINAETLNIDTNKIERLVTKSTSAIVPVHVFGNPCEVEKINQLSSEYNLKVIYDAAHAFDIGCCGRNVLNFGDASTMSFHATKIFHTIEGGAIFTNDDDLAEKIRRLINFGILDENTLLGLGTNAKMNEFEAAMGLCILDDIDKIKENRLKTVALYKNALSNLPGVSFQKSSVELFSYMPVIFDSEEILFRVMNALAKNNIVARRYFYPSLNKAILYDYEGETPISESISSRIMCLPLFYDISCDEVNKVLKVIKEVL